MFLLRGSCGSVGDFMITGRALRRLVGDDAYRRWPEVARVEFTECSGQLRNYFGTNTEAISASDAITGARAELPCYDFDVPLSVSRLRVGQRVVRRLKHPQLRRSLISRALSSVG